MKDGYIQQIGTPRDLYFSPVNVFVAGFIGEPPMNFIRCTVSNGCVAIGDAQLDLSVKLKDRLAEYEGKEIIFGFRPESIALGEQENAYNIGCRVELTEMLGDNVNVYIDIKDEKAILKVDPFNAPAIDSDISFSIPYESVYLFEGDTERVINA